MLLKNHWWRWNQEKGAFVGVAHVDIDFCALVPTTADATKVQ
jgi:hypothetical protein